MLKEYPYAAVHKEETNAKDGNISMSGDSMMCSLCKSPNGRDR